MALIDQIVAEANDVLKLHDYPDYGPMGLQFKGAAKVRKITCAVSASYDVIEAAAKHGSQALIVHHGLFWNNESRLFDSRVGGRIKLLRETGISLLAYHLALDAHPEFGNNVLAARALGLEGLTPFAEIGFGGYFKEPVTIEEMRVRAFKAFGKVPVVFPFGGRQIASCAVITGGAPQYIVEAARREYDAYLTGEPAEPSIYLAKEYGIHFLANGHHATEKAGVKVLTKTLAESFGVPWKFIDTQNPV